MWNRNHMTEWGHSSGMGTIGIVGIVITLLLIIILVLVIFAILRLLKRTNVNATTHTQMPSNTEALTILQARYAKGEIDEEEYLNRKKVLQNKDE